MHIHLTLKLAEDPRAVATQETTLFGNEGGLAGMAGGGFLGWADPENDHQMIINDVQVNYSALNRALLALDPSPPREVWLHVRAAFDSPDRYTNVEWSETPFDDEQQTALDETVRDALIPKEVQDGVRHLREFDDLEDAVVNTMSGLYSKATYDGWVADPEAKFHTDEDPPPWDNPHIEADNIKLAHFYNYPCGLVVTVPNDPESPYVSDVRPMKEGERTSSLYTWGFEEGDGLPEGWSSFNEADFTPPAPIMEHTEPDGTVWSVDINGPSAVLRRDGAVVATGLIPPSPADE